MTSLSRNISPISTLENQEVDNDDEYYEECSFALEYTGPPLSNDIHRAAPIDLGRIHAKIWTSSLKEVCIVSDTKCISDNVLRVMESMPERRKCLPRNGYRINESKRGNLGKFSRMVKRFVNDSEVKQRRLIEVSIQVDQFPPWLIIVNGRPISGDELVLLQSCKNPPKRLKPGNYWYDKVSGLWGKEGHRPSQIISSQLAVGGAIMREASHGNTNILINNREITRVELYMVQMAGINWDGYRHLWLSDDGSYQEEGHNQVLGKLWGKARVKLVSAILSLPVPSNSASSSEGVDNNSDNGQGKEKRSLRKLLMVGHDHSGISTIFKQAKILYGSPFSEDDRRQVKCTIQSNMYGYLGILLEGRKRFEEEISIEMRRKKLISLVLQAAEISKDDYEPSDKDILYSDGIDSSNSLSCMEFYFPKPAHESLSESADQHYQDLRYQLTRVYSKSLGDNCQWGDMFADVNLLLYCIDLTSYDQIYEDRNGVATNKMLESKKLFESIVTHGNFNDKEFVLVLNKFDLLEEKIKHFPLSQCDWFHDFNPVITHHQSAVSPLGYIGGHNNTQLGQCAYHYIAQKFKKLFDSLTGRKLYVSPPVTGLEGDSVDALFKYGREILNWIGEDKPSFSNYDWSSDESE